MVSSSAELFGDPELARVGIDVGERLHGGFQSVVHAARWKGADVVVKAELEPDPWLDARMTAVAAAARANPQVVPPLELDGALVHALADRRYVLHPFVAGLPPSITDATQVEEMGRSLARLHATLRSLDGSGLPDVSALRALDADDVDLAGERQLIHADFGTSNLIVSSDGLRILDFGEMGFGTAALDVANTIFIERFSAALDGRLADADRFAEVFVAAYTDESGSPIGPDDVELGLDVRRRALGRWLDDPERAPVGIARSSPEWRRQLRRYAETDPTAWGSID